MGTIQELYDSRVRPMPPAERLQLARLIIDDLATSDKPVDVRDDWSDDDVVDLTTHATDAANADLASVQAKFNKFLPHAPQRHSAPRLPSPRLADRERVKDFTKQVADLPPHANV